MRQITLALFGVPLIVAGGLPSPTFAAPRAAGTRAGAETKAVAHRQETQLERETLARRQIAGGRFGFVTMRPEVKIGSDEFFARYAADLGLRSGDRLELASTRLDPLFRDHSRKSEVFRQLYKGIPVLGGSYRLESEANGRVVAGSGRLITGLSLSPKPQVTESAAGATARAAIPQPSAGQGSGSPQLKGKLVVTFQNLRTPTVHDARLAWQFRVATADQMGAYTVDVDAHDGHVLHVVDERRFDVPTWNQTQTCKGTILDAQPGAVKLACDRGADGRFRIMCRPGATDCPFPLRIIDGRRPNPQVFPGQKDTDDYAFTDDNGNGWFGESGVIGWTPGTETADRPGVRLYSELRRLDEFFETTFGWKGLDGNGTSALDTLVVTAPPVDIAGASSWFQPATSTTVDQLAFVEAYLNNLPILAGHEYTHGVVQYLSGSLYARENAMINEAFSYIFSVVSLAGDLSGRCCRELPLPGINVTPLKQNPVPTQYQGFYWVKDNGKTTGYDTPNGFITCVDASVPCDATHQNAFVQVAMFRCLVTGCAGVQLTKPTITPVLRPYFVSRISSYDAARIGFRVATNLAAIVLFTDARDVWIEAARYLYGAGSDEERAVTDAWNAVGVGDSYDEGLLMKPADQHDVSSWPAKLEAQTKSNQWRWRFEISSSPLFDKDVQRKTVTTDFCPIPARPPGDLGEGPQYPDDRRKPGPPPACRVDTAAEFNLKPLTNYYWHVVGQGAPPAAPKDGGGSTDPNQNQPAINTNPVFDTTDAQWSPTKVFKTDARATQLGDPAEAGKVYPWGDSDFTWAAVGGATKYLVEISEGIELSQFAGRGRPLRSLRSQPPAPGAPGTDWVDPARLANPRVDEITYHLGQPLKVGHGYFWGVLPYGPENLVGTWSHGGSGRAFVTSTPHAQLDSPEAGFVESPWAVPLTWKGTVGAVGYALTVTAPPATENLAPDPAPKGTSELVNLPVLNQSYRWSVAPQGPPPWNEIGAPSARTFTVDPNLTKPVLLSPPDQDWVPYLTRGTQFKWSAVRGAVSYQLFIYRKGTDGSCGSTPIRTESVIVSNTDPVAFTALNPTPDHDSDRCWRVLAIGPAGTPGVLSDPFIFRVGPDEPVLVSPANGATGVPYGNVSISWSSQWHPWGYDVRVSNAATLTKPISEQRTAAQTLTVPLAASAQYVVEIMPLRPDGSMGTIGKGQFSTRANSAPMCNQDVYAGSDNPETHVIQLGKPSGTVTLYIDTFNVPDRITVTYEGKQLVDTGCFGTNSAAQNCLGSWCCDGNGVCGTTISYGGSSTQMTVQVTPNCSGTIDTQWRFKLTCP